MYDEITASQFSLHTVLIIFQTLPFSKCLEMLVDNQACQKVFFTAKICVSTIAEGIPRTTEKGIYKNIERNNKGVL
jgi:hypothetical protein